MTKKKAFYALDADGCIYNHFYHFLLLYLADKYENVIIEAINDDREEALVREMIEDLNTLTNKLTVENNTENFKSLYKETCESLISKNTLNYDNANPRDFFIKKRLQILNQINILAKLGYGDLLLKNILFNSNRALFNKIIENVSTQSIDEITILSASNRQNNRHDQYCANYNGTGLFAKDIIYIKEILKELAPTKNVNYDAYNLSHVYGKNDYFDETKFTIVYALSQHLAKKHNKPMDLYYFDDREDIRSAVISIFGNVNAALPAKTNLIVWPYNGSLETPTHISGQGPIDYNYKENIKKIVMLCPKQKHRVVDVINQIPNATLKDFIEQRNVNKDRNNFFAPQTTWQQPPQVNPEPTRNQLGMY